MLNAIVKEDTLPFKYVLADSLYAISPEFIEAVEALPGKTYFVQVPKDTLCWPKRPLAVTKQHIWGGKTISKTILVDPDSKPISV